MKRSQQTPFGTIYGDVEILALTDVAFFQEGPGLRKWQWTDDGMKVINGRNILLDYSIDLSNTDKYISLEEFHKTYSHFAVERGDIVVTSSGTIGKVARINASHLPLMMNTSPQSSEARPGFCLFSPRRLRRTGGPAGRIFVVSVSMAWGSCG